MKKVFAGVYEEEDTLVLSDAQLSETLLKYQALRERRECETKEAETAIAPVADHPGTFRPT